MDEIENAIKNIEYKNVILMYGFQNYPTFYESINLNKLNRLMHLFTDNTFGYAYHTDFNETDNLLITMFGAPKGVKYIEKHSTLEYGKNRIDNSSAITVEMIDILKSKIQLLEACNGTGLMRLDEGELKYSINGKMKNIPLAKSFIKMGKTITMDDICFKRANQYSDITQMEIISLVGKKLTLILKKMKHLEKSIFYENRFFNHCRNCKSSITKENYSIHQ